MYKETGEESELYGPFTRDEMELWKESKYFEENEKQMCTFIKSVDHQKKNENWLFIDDIATFKN